MKRQHHDSEGANKGEGSIQVDREGKERGTGWVEENKTGPDEERKQGRRMLGGAKEKSRLPLTLTLRSDLKLSLGESVEQTSLTGSRSTE